MFAITSIYAALCALLIVVLAYRVVVVRRGEKIGLGDAGNRLLERRVRIHGNAIENVPLALILLALTEAAGVAALWLHAAGATLVLARLLHAWGLTVSPGYSVGRFSGVALTWLVQLSLSSVLLIRPLLAGS